MQVGGLRRALEGLPDDALVVIEAAPSRDVYLNVLSAEGIPQGHDAETGEAVERSDDIGPHLLIRVGIDASALAK